MSQLPHHHWVNPRCHRLVCVPVCEMFTVSIPICSITPPTLLGGSGTQGQASSGKTNKTSNNKKLQLSTLTFSIYSVVRFRSSWSRRATFPLDFPCSVDVQQESSSVHFTSSPLSAAAECWLFSPYPHTQATGNLPGSSSEFPACLHFLYTFVIPLSLAVPWTPLSCPLSPHLPEVMQNLLQFEGLFTKWASLFPKRLLLQTVRCICPLLSSLFPLRTVSKKLCSHIRSGMIVFYWSQELQGWGIRFVFQTDRQTPGLLKFSH